MEFGKLPEGWQTAELSEICAVNPTIDKSAIADDLSVSFVPMPAVEAESGVIAVSTTRKFGEVKKGYTPFREGDVLFAKITPCMENGKMAVVPALHNGLGFGSTEFHVLRAHPGISPQFVYYFVSSRAFRHVAEHNMSGAVGQRRVTTPYLSACKIPVPPTAEQHRIVAKIEELFSELDQGVASLKTAREQLKVYRQSLLKNAFEGKLTAAWRVAHADQLETAEALQKRIATERQTRHQQQLANWQTTGQPGPKPKPPKPLPPLTAEELAELPELPAGWGWEKLGNFSELTGGVTKGKDLAGKTVVSLPYLRVANVQDGYLNLHEVKNIDVESKDLSKYRLVVGDVLYTEGGDKDKLGRGAVWRGQIDPCIHQNHIFRARVSGEFLSPNFLSLYSQARGAKDYFFRHAKQTTNLASINLTVLGNLPVVILDSLEQRQILQELESKLSEADQLDQTLSTTLQQADALRQSILKKAFCGQLVKQAKNEEPATALLEHIRAARSGHQPASRGSPAGSQL